MFAEPPIAKKEFRKSNKTVTFAPFYLPLNDVVLAVRQIDLSRSSHKQTIS